jgi:hypothetical protein
MYLRDATIHQYLPPIQYLNGYAAYRGGQSVWNYIATKYGDQKIAEILIRIKSTRSVEQGFRSAIGLGVEELSERWMKEQKVLYWPDIAKRDDPADYAKRLTDHTKDGSFYNTSPTLSPQGDKLAFISNRDDYFDVFLMNTVDGKVTDKLVDGQRTADFEELHLLTPGMTWSPDGRKLALAVKSGSEDAIIIIDTEDGDEQKLEFGLDGIFSVDWSPVDSARPAAAGRLAFVGIRNGQSDIYIYDLDDKRLTNLTDDIFSDADPAWTPDGHGVIFSSDRRGHLGGAPLPASFRMHTYDFGQLDLYRADVGTSAIVRITDLPNSDETSPVAGADGRHVLFISDLNGINNIYVYDLDSNSYYPLTNSLSGVYQLSVAKDGNKLAFGSLIDGGFDLFLMRNPLDLGKTYSALEPTEYFRRLTERRKPSAAAATKADSLHVTQDVIVHLDGRDSTEIYGSDVKIDLRNYVFNDALRPNPDAPRDTAHLAPIADNVDTAGNYRVSRYKLNFSPDIVYGNAGYNTFYGVEGSTIMAFSDMLGDHQIYILTNLLFDLKNSDYALAYLYLPRRIDYGMYAFHSARFVLLDNGQFGENLYRFRNYGVTGLASYPVNKFNRFEFNLSWFNITRDNLDVAQQPSEHRSLLVPSLSYVHDNALWGLVAPANGERYNLSVMSSPSIGGDGLSFTTVTLDVRKYYRVARNYTFAIRVAGGGSFGRDPQRFIIGGVDNWINRTFENDKFPVESAEDYVFLTTGVPLRGYNYSARTGSKYAIVNMEFRFPLFGYLSAGPLPVFFQSLNGVLFLDVGGAWTHQSDFKAFDKTASGATYMRDLLAGTGYGIRMAFLGFLLKMDVAWAFNLQEVSAPKYYFSLGTDI